MKTKTAVMKTKAAVIKTKAAVIVIIIRYCATFVNKSSQLEKLLYVDFKFW